MQFKNFIITHETTPSDSDYEVMINYLSNSGQLIKFSGTENTIRRRSKKWFIARDEETNEIAGFCSVKYPDRDGFDYEVGYLFIIPKYRLIGLGKKLIQSCVESESGSSFYGTTLHPFFQKLFKESGWKLIDEWESRVHEGRMIQLWTNKDVTIIEEGSLLHTRDVLFVEYIHKAKVLHNACI